MQRLLKCILILTEKGKNSVLILLLPSDSKETIEICKASKLYDGSGKKVPTVSEKDERLWRADPTDGLRPHKSIRSEF